jgi:hypothetical protein
MGDGEGTNLNKKCFVLDQLEQPRQVKNLLYLYLTVLPDMLFLGLFITSNSKIYLETLTGILHG